MSTMRWRAGTIQVLFVFDSRRAIILLIDGDQRDRWSALAPTYAQSSR